MHISLDQNHPKAPRAGALARELFTARRAPFDQEVLNDTVTAIFNEVREDPELLALVIYSQAVLVHYALGLAEALLAKPESEMQKEYAEDPEGVRAWLTEALMAAHLSATDPDAAGSGGPLFW